MLQKLKYVRYAPDTPTLNKIILLFTLDILYIHHSFPFAMGTTKAAARKKKVIQTQHKYRDSPPRPNYVNSKSI